jgi:anti-sigma factor RsiW
MEPGGSKDLLLDHAAGKLNAGAQTEVSRHIGICAECREFTSAQQAVWQALEDWEPADVSLDFDRRLYARIEHNVPWWMRLLRPLNPLFRHAVPIAAAAGVVIMAGLMLNRPEAAPVAPSPQSAQLESLQPEQLQSALDDMEMLHEFNHLVPDSAAEPKM